MIGVSTFNFLSSDSYTCTSFLSYVIWWRNGNIKMHWGLYECVEFFFTFYCSTSNYWTFVFFLTSTWLGLPLYKTPSAHPASTPSNISTQLANFTTPETSNTPALNKRKESKIVSVAPPLAKRSRGKSSARTIAQQGEYLSHFCAYIYKYIFVLSVSCL